MDQEKKRKSGSGDEEEEEEEKENNPKKKARTTFKISTEWQKLIKKDAKNCKNWEQVISREVANKKEFTDYVEELFNCIICQEIVYKPSTTPCGHNFCMECLERSFNSGKKDCPSCRAELDEDSQRMFKGDWKRGNMPNVAR